MDSEKSTSYLTGVRGIAAILVLLGHATNHYFEGTRHFSIPFAEFAMSLFFVLSGFVLTLNYTASFNTLPMRHSLYDFFLARFARLAPLYFIMVFIIENSAQKFSGWPPLLSYILMAQSWVNNQYIALTLTWSVSTEFFFYLLFPIALFFLRSGNVRHIFKLFLMITICGVCMSLAFYYMGQSLVDALPVLFSGDAENDWKWIRYYNPYLRIFDFFIGCVSAKFYMNRSSSVFSPRMVLSVAHGCFLAIALLLLYRIAFPADKNFVDFICYNFAFAPFTGLLLATMGMNRNLWQTRIAEARFLIFAGTLSYSLYLLHFTAFDFFPKYAELFLKHDQVKAIYYAGGIWLTFAFSYVSYHLVENPARRAIRKRFARKEHRQVS